MPEGVAVAGRRIKKAVHDDPETMPAPGPDAPKGWTWNRNSKSWKAKVRGATLWRDDSGAGMVSGESPERASIADSASDLHETPAPDRDPDPAFLTPPSPGGGEEHQDGRVRFEDVPAQVKDDIAGLAGLIGTPILALLQSVDPYCGTVLAQNFEPVVDAALPLICRSEKIVKYFSEDSADWLLWGKLALALKPVGQAFVEHHLFRTVHVVREADGRTTIVRGEKPAESDHLTPPVAPEFPYAA